MKKARISLKQEMKKRKLKELRVKCSCGCKAQLLVQNVDNDMVMIDTREDGRSKWIGVVLEKKEIQKLKEFLREI